MALESWVNFQTTSGSGNGTISVSASVHTGRKDRGGENNYITVTGGGVTVKAPVVQEGKPEFVSIAVTEFKPLPSGESVTITGKSNSSKLTFSWGSGSALSTTLSAYTANNKGATSGTAISGDPGASKEFPFSITIQVPNNTSTSAKSSTLVITANGGQQATATISQAAGQKVYANPVITAFTYRDATASGTSAAVTALTYSQAWTWNGVAGSGGTITSGASVVYSGTNVNATSGAVSASPLGTTLKARTQLTTSTATVTLNGRSASASYDVYQQENLITNIAPAAYRPELGVSYYTDTIAAGGGNSSPYHNAYAVYTFTSGSTLTSGSAGGNVISGTTIAYTRSYAVDDTLSGHFSLLSNGTVTAKTRGTTPGNAQSIDVAVTLVVTATYTDALAEIPAVSGTATTTTPVTQQANSLGTVKFKDTSGTLGSNLILGTPTKPSLTGSITASGGSLTASSSVTNTRTYYLKWTSGSWSGLQSVGEAGSVAYALSTNSNDRFSVSGSTITHAAMGTHATTDTVGVYAYNTADSSLQSASNHAAATNAKSTVYDGWKSYGQPYIAIGSGLTAAGGSATVTTSCTNDVRYYHYEYTDTSANEAANARTTEWTPTYSWEIKRNDNNRFSVSGNTISHSSMGTDATTDVVTVTIYNLRNTDVRDSASVSITNSLGTVKYKDTSGTYGYNIMERGTPTTPTLTNNLTAAGGSVTCSGSTVSDSISYYLKYSSGSYSSVQTGSVAGTVAYKIASNGNSRFSISGSTVSHESMTTNVTTDTVTIQAYNTGNTYKVSLSATASVSNAVTGVYSARVYCDNFQLRSAINSTDTKEVTSLYALKYTSGAHDAEPQPGVVTIKSVTSSDTSVFKASYNGAAVTVQALSANPSTSATRTGTVVIQTSVQCGDFTANANVRPTITQDVAPVIPTTSGSARSLGSV